ARDVLFMQFGLEGNIINCDALEQLRVLAGRYKPSDVRNIIGAISQTREQLQRNINPRLALETMVLALECPERVPAKI
ncbi:MAG: DNA polymerase III subunit delta' C-terminal domain-containing protein, partial [Dehalococcoidales bacterium]